ncbi:unnamed protein product, partial [Ixodes persulcatus]
MSWFDTAGFANLAKSALNSAQKTIDRALDIQQDGSSTFTLPTGNLFASAFRSFAESPLVIDFPNYASLEQSAESDGSTDTLLGASLPGSSSSSNQSRESFSDWQDSAKESRDRGTVVVREPEHVTDVGFLSRQPADDGGPTEPVASEQSDVVDGAIVKPPEAASRSGTESSSTQIEAPVHKSDEAGVHSFFVVVDSTTAVEEAKALREDPHASGAGDGWSESVCSRLGDESGDEVKAGDEAELCDSGSKTPVTGGPPKEDVDLQSVAGSLQSVDTSSSASFVRISAEETEDSRKSSSPSGDEEGETVSSSDIEIISSPNGGSSCDQFSGVLPARHLWEMRRESREEKRSESPETVEDSRDPLASALESSPSRLGEHMSEEEKLRARVNELQGVLDARERKVFLLSKEIAEMSDSNAALQSSLRQAEELRSKESQDVSRLTQEFTHRLAKLETRLLDTSRERDTLKSRLEAVQQESVTKVSISQMDVLLKEKDEQIAELMSEGKCDVQIDLLWRKFSELTQTDDTMSSSVLPMTSWPVLGRAAGVLRFQALPLCLAGEKLSKQHLQQSTIIKKLRAKEKDMENVIKSHKERLEDQSKELDRLRRSMSAKDDQEKKHIDTIRQLTSSNHKLEKDAKDLEVS